MDGTNEPGLNQTRLVSTVWVRLDRLDLWYKSRTKYLVPLTTVSLKKILNFNLKQKTVFTNDVGHNIWFPFRKYYLEKNLV